MKAFSQKTSKQKALWIILAVTAALAAVAVILYFTLGAKQKAHYAAVYTKGAAFMLKTQDAACTLPAKEGDTVAINQAQTALFYSVQTEEGRSLYYCDLTDAAAVRKGGVCVAKSIGQSWFAGESGRYVAYQKADSKALACYSVADGQTTTVAPVALDFYPAMAQDTLFFTRGEDGHTLLYRFVYGATPEQLAVDAEDIHLFSDASALQLFFTKPQEEGNSLYAIGATGGVALVTEDVANIDYDDYLPSGNLYYYKAVTMGLDWHSFVEDNNAQADAALQEPNPKDYESSFIILGYFKEQAYQAAKEAYDAKVERDKLRALLADLDMGTQHFDCYGYDGACSYLLAPDLEQASILAKAPFGTPRLVYQKMDYEAQVETKQSLTDLLGQYGTPEQAAQAVQAMITQTGTYKGTYLANQTQSGVYDVELAGLTLADKSLCFVEGGKRLIYVAADAPSGRNNVFSYEITEYGISQRQTVDTQVTDYAVLQDEFYYAKREGERESLHRFANGKQEKLCANVDSFLETATGAVLAFANVKDGVGDVYLCGEKSLLAAKDAAVKSVSAQSNHQICYIKQESDGTGQLWCYYGKETVLDRGVTRIIA